MAEGDVYDDPKIAAARAIHEARKGKGKGKGTVLVECETDAQAKACERYIKVLFLDEPLLAGVQANDGRERDGFKLNNGRSIIVSSLPRSPSNLIVALKLTAPVEAPVASRSHEEMSTIEKLSHLTHVFCVELSRRETALTPDAHKLLKSLCPDTSDDPVKARQELVDAFERMTAEHAAQRAAEWEARYGVDGGVHGGTVNYTRTVMAPTSVPVIPMMTEEEKQAQISRIKMANDGLRPPPRQTKAIM